MIVGSDKNGYSLQIFVASKWLIRLLCGEPLNGYGKCGVFPVWMDFSVVCFLVKVIAWLFIST